MPPPPFGHGFRNDVFISYAHLDNEPDADGRRWVGQFCEDLVRRLQMVSGRTVTIWRDDRLDASDLLDPAIEAELATSAMLVPILSPSYFASDACRRELEHFLRLDAATQTPGVTKSRIVKVAKTRVDRSLYPAQLAGMLEHPFYKEEPNGSFKEFHIHERPEVRSVYATAVDDVAQEISRRLAALEGQKPAATPHATVFLALATGDVDTERNHLRRFLQQDGCEVLPATNLPLEAGALERDVKGALQASKLAVFVMGCRYGWVPEMGEGKSFVRLQLEHAAQYAAQVPRVIWIPPGLKVSEQAQIDLVDRVRREFPGRGFEVVESNVQSLLTHLRDRLQPKAPPPAPAAPDGGQSDVHLYLMVDRCDRDAARPLRQYLLASGFGVDWLPATGEASTIGQLHREWLLNDDAFLIFYGASDDAWIKCQGQELRKAKGLGRRTPAKTRIVLAAPPSDDKEDLRVSPVVIDGLPPKELKDALCAFLKELEPAGTAGRGSGPPAETV
jgi:TIR domain